MKTLHKAAKLSQEYRKKRRQQFENMIAIRIERIEDVERYIWELYSSFAINSMARADLLKVLQDKFPQYLKIIEKLELLK